MGGGKILFTASGEAREMLEEISPPQPLLTVTLKHQSCSASYTAKSNIQPYDRNTLGILLYLSGGWRRKDIPINGQTMALKQKQFDSEQKL